MTTQHGTEERLSTDDLAQPTAPPPEAVHEDEDDAIASDPVARDSAPASSQPLVEQADDDGFRSRWESIQAGFVDEPRDAVEQADALVAELMQRLAETFSNERKSLEGQWDRGQDVSTEDLRVALQRYRSFFDRLLSS